MRMELYNFLVNRHSGIRSRYHKIHDNGGTGRRLVSYAYLLFLNFCYYCLFCRFLAKEKTMEIYEEKRLPELPESGLRSGEGFTVESFVETLSQYDVVSFDVFDTLIFRPFSSPTDLFYFLGDRLGLLDVRRIRVEQEASARRDCFEEKGHYEVTFEEIWNRMEREIGIPAERGMLLERELESEFCYANPFLLQVFEALRARGKRIICISDMYLPRAFLRELLEKNGYTGTEKLYVSCEHGRSKAKGDLYRLVREEFPQGTTFIHVGDNEQSDVKMAQKCGFAVKYYPNVNKQSQSFRPYDMSPVIGGAYRGIVNNRLYRGGSACSPEYEYGFIYGGLFVLGYCHFIHEYCCRNGVEKLLFLSRDGNILKEVYDRLYPDDNTAYVYWSRMAATKLMAEFDSCDYFRRFLYHKVNQGISIGAVLEAMELQSLAGLLSDYVDITGEAGAAEDAKMTEAAGMAGKLGTTEEAKINGKVEMNKEVRTLGEAGMNEKAGKSKQERTVLRLSDELTDKNVDALKRFIQAHYTEVCDKYREEQRAAKVYYEKELAGIERAAAIDIGWAGSGAVSLSYLVEQVWNLPSEIAGIIAGTNTLHNDEPDAGEIFLQNGKLVSYLFSQSHNRDVMKKHDPGKDYNVYWELLLSSPQRKFLGFRFAEGDSTGIYSEDGREVMLLFGEKDANQEGILEIRRGIQDFVSDYVERFRKEPFMFRISGRDACAPMLVAASYNERYLKRIAGRFALEKGI